MTPGHNWTESDLRTLRNMWTAGASARQIAAELGQGLTRSNVLGKARRIGLEGRVVVAGEVAVRKQAMGLGQSAASRAAALKSSRRLGPLHKAGNPPAAPGRRILHSVPLQPVETAGGIPFLEVNDRRCRWPLWEEFSSDSRCCGEPIDFGRVYCDRNRHQAGMNE